MTESTRLQKTYISVAQNASGRNLHVPIYTIDDGKPGPTVYIQSSIHGSEVQGNVVIYQLIKLLKDIEVHGKVILVPNCNPVGTNIKAGEYTLGRFDPVNGTNWNRGYFFDEAKVHEFANNLSPNTPLNTIKDNFRNMWRQAINEKLAQPWGLGLAQQLNLKLQQIAATADLVLDLHNGPVSCRHLYVPEYAKSAALEFSIPHCIFIPNKFAGALDEACFCPWWTLQEILHAKWGEEVDFKVQAFTLEMGSQEHINFAEGEDDANSILAYLACHDVLFATQYKPKKMKRIGVALSDYKTLYTDFGGMVEYCAEPGVLINKGEHLAKILNIDELDNQDAMHELFAPCDLIPILHFPSASVLSGTQLYKCFTNFFDI